MYPIIDTRQRLKPEEALGIPLKEIDRTILEETFCIIERHWGETYVYRYSRLPSLYLFSPYSIVRRASISHTTNVFYDIILLLVVLANLVELAIPDALPLFFLRVTMLFYLFEAVHQTIARGFIVGSYAYLRNPWMCLDFIITLICLPDLVFDYNSSFRAMTLRGVRVVHLVTKIPGVRIMAQGILSSLIRMYGVVTIMALFLVAVALTGKQWFMGLFHQRCVKNFPFNFSSANSSFNDFINDEDNWDVNHLEEFVVCGNTTDSLECRTNYTCLIVAKNQDATNFDTFSFAAMCTFRLFTQDDWEEIYDLLMQSVGRWSILFFLPVIFLGSFFLFNLMLVVVNVSYESALSSKKTRALRSYKYSSEFEYDVQDLQLFPLPTSPEELRRVFRERDEIIVHRYWLNGLWQKLKKKLTLKPSPVRLDQNLDMQSLGCWMKLRMRCKKIVDSPSFQYFILGTIIGNTTLMASEHANMSDAYILVLRYANLVITGIYVFELTMKLMARGRLFFYSLWNIMDLVLVLVTVLSLVLHTSMEYSIFRSLRLFELVKVQKVWPAFHRVISSILNSMGNIFRLLLVVGLVIFTFSVIGNRIIGPLMKPDAEYQRWSFKTFGGSMFTIFKIFAGAWYEPINDCMETTTTPYVCPAIIIPFYVIGFLVIWNVFTAVLLSAFDSNVLQFSKPWQRRRVTESWKRNKSIIGSNEHVTKFQRFLLYLKAFIRSANFERIIFVIVLVSSVVMAFEDKDIYSKPTQLLVVNTLNHILTILFVIEVLLKWFAIGIRVYFESYWRRFDFLLVVLSIVEIFIGIGITGKHGHQYTYLRCLRPVRLIPRWKKLELVVYSLALSLPSIFHVVLVVLFIWLPFGILGVHFFGGNFFRCVGPFKNRIYENVYNKTDCIAQGYKWEEMFYNFNHIGNSYICLFQLAMFTGWSELVEMMLDFNEKDLQPVIDKRKRFYIYIVIFVFVGAFFSINLFVGVAIDTFRNIKKEVEMGKTELLLTDGQKKYRKEMLQLGTKKHVERVQKPSSKLLNACYIISYSIWFRGFIMLLIFANTVTVSLDNYDDQPHKKQIMHHFDLFFTVCYIFECVIKLLGLRKYYFHDYWNIFSLGILVTHIIGDIAIIFIPGGKPLSFLYPFRLLQVLLLLRLTDLLIDLRRLLHSTLAAIPALINISILLLIIIYVYAICGMSVFAHVKIAGMLSDQLNFQTCVSSYLLLFRLTTAQGWEGLLESLSIEPPYCSEEEGNCGHYVFAALYVLSFIVITYIILVNMFAAVILDNYIEVMKQEVELISERNLRDFYLVWRMFDKKTTLFIAYEQLSDFLDALNEEMQIPKPNHNAIASMNLHINNQGKIHCLNVLKGILEVKAEAGEDSITFPLLYDEVEKAYIKLFPKWRCLMFLESITDQMRRKDQAAKIIQRNLRRIRERKLEKRQSQRKSIFSFLS